MFCKETEFQVTKTGKIPSDWQAATLSELSEHITKGTTPTTYGFSYESSGVNFIKVESINENGKFILENVPHISEEANNALSRSILKEKDILFSIAGALGRVALVTADILPANVNQALSIIRIKEQEKVLPEYLKYFLMGPNVQGFVKSIAIQSQQANLNLEQVRDFKVGLPAVAEQRAIVGVLGVVDSAIEYTNRVIAKTERLKRGLMQQLLTRGIGHTETKQTPIGQIPENWAIVALGDVSDDFIGGGTPSTTNPEYWNGDIAWMTSAHINGKQITRGQKYITKEGLENSATHLIPKDNLLVATRVGIGKVAVNTIDIAISQDLTGVIINRKKALPEFLYWVLINNGNRLKALAQGSTIKGLLKEDLSKFQIPLPTLEEQQRIDEILSTADKKLELERGEKVRLERIKRGLMDLLLTGKVRIKVD